MKRGEVWIKWAIAMFVSGMLAGCSDAPLPKGRVVDAESGQPVAGAYVLARYVGDGPYVWPDPGATARQVCYGSLVTQTDEQGEYDFASQQADKPFTREYRRNQYVEVTAYKPGYTMERVGKYHESVKGRSVFVRYEKASGEAQHLALTDAAISAYDSRQEYMASLFGGHRTGFCGDITVNHWRMGKTILDEEVEWATTLRQWGHAKAVCEYLNEENAKKVLGQKLLDCTVYQAEIENLEARRFARLKAIVDDIDWGKGPKLELALYEPLPSFLDESNAAFVLTRFIQADLAADDVNVLLSRTCEAGLALERSYICIADKFEERIWRDRARTDCLAQYRPVFRNILIQSGKRRGEEKRLPEGWCGQ